MEGSSTPFDEIFHINTYYSNIYHPSFFNIHHVISPEWSKEVEISTLEFIMNTLRSDWSNELHIEVKKLIIALRPPDFAIQTLKLTLDRLSNSMFKHLRALVLPTCITPYHVLLPGENIELTLIIPSLGWDNLSQQEKLEWKLEFHRIMESIGDKFPQSLNSIQFNRQKLDFDLHFNRDHLHISLNDLSSIYCSALFDDIDRMVSDDVGLMKNSLILIKAWILHEVGSSPHPYHEKGSPQIIPPFLLQLLVMHLFCIYSIKILHSPIAALIVFLHYYSNLDFENSVIDMDMSLTLQAENDASNSKRRIKSMLNQYQSRYNTISAHFSSLYSGGEANAKTEQIDQHQVVKVVHPLCPTKNMGSHITTSEWGLIQKRL